MIALLGLSRSDFLLDVQYVVGTVYTAPVDYTTYVQYSVGTVQYMVCPRRSDVPTSSFLSEECNGAINDFRACN
jgi:hypothetical protein